ncbi:MAG TPA: hypothetical protein VH744_00555 [Terriglobales bacterium]|jgi:hypothetical protein
MPDRKIEQIVERVVSQVLEDHIPQVRGDIVRSVLAELKPQLGASGEPKSGPNHLLKAISAIHGVSTQRDVLRALLDNAVRYCGRAALFVVKGGMAGGWQGRAFANNEAIKDFALDVASGLVARVLDGHTALAGNTKEMDHKFIAQFGAPADSQCVLIPLLLRDKVAALIYADAGPETGGHLDSSALELLVLTTGTWLELASLRKTAAPAGGEKREAPAIHAAAAHASHSLSDPFAAHAPAFSKSASAAPAAHAEPEPAETVTADQFAGLPSDDAEVHRKAQRFARLLVDEIKLYNQAKMSEGRKNRDIYDRLKEDIEKSRSTYQKRYGSTVAGSGDYFIQEVIRSLAEDDVSLLGSSFKR